MAGVWFWLQRDWAARWRSSLVIAALVAMTGGTVLALAAGARRTDASLDRFDRVSRDDGAFIDAAGTDPAPLRALGHHPQVEALGEVALMAVFPPAEGFFPFFASVDGGPGRDLYRGLLLRGQRPDPDDPHQVALPETMAQGLGADIGSRLRLASMTPEQWASVNASGAFPDTFLGPPVELQVVGIVRTTIDLAQRPDDPNPALLTPAFFEAYRQRIGMNPDLFLLRLHGGADAVPAFRRLLENAYGHKPLPVVDFASAVEGPRGATRVVTTGLLVAAGTALIAGLSWLALALHRHASGASRDLPVLTALGFGPRAQFAVLLGTAVPGLALGTAAAAAAAALASPLFPVGLARRADPDVGLHVDALVLGPGVLALGLLASGLAALGALRSRQTALRDRPSVPTPVTGLVRRVATGLGPVTATGLAFALRPERGERRVPVRSTVAGAALGLVGVVAVGIVGASLGRLLDTPARYGATWDTAVALPDRARAAVVAAEGDVAAAAVGLFQRPVAVKGRLVFAYALDPVKGELPPAIAAGRAPVTPDEVALGRDTLDKAGLAVGGTVALGTKAPAQFRIVGQAVIPTPGSPGRGTDYEDPLSVADGALLTPAGLARLERTEDAGDFGFEKLLIRWQPGVDHDAAVAQLGDDSAGASAPRPGPEIGRLAEVERFPRTLAAFLVAVSVVAVAHGVSATVRRRRHDLAVLGALGFTSGQRRQVVACQASVLAALVVTLGMPLGIATGRWAWAAMGRDLGVATDAAVPSALIGLAVTGTLVVFGLLAAWTGRGAARINAVRVLRAE